MTTVLDSVALEQHPGLRLMPVACQQGLPPMATTSDVSRCGLCPLGNKIPRPQQSRATGLDIHKDLLLFDITV